MWYQVTRHPQIFRELTVGQRTLGFWGVTDLTQLVSRHLHHMIWLTTMHSLPPSIVHLLFIKPYLTFLSVSLHMTFILCKVCQFSFFMKIKYIFIFMMILLNSVIITLTDDDYIDDDAMQLCVMIVPPFRRSAHTHRVR